MTNPLDDAIHTLAQQISEGTNGGAVKTQEWRERSAAALGASKDDERYSAVEFLSDNSRSETDEVIAVAEDLVLLGYLAKQPDGSYLARFPEDT